VDVLVLSVVDDEEDVEVLVLSVVEVELVEVLLDVDELEELVEVDDELDDVELLVLDVVDDEVLELVELEVDDVVVEVVVVVAQPHVVMTSPFASTYAKPAGLAPEPSFTPLSMMSLFELSPLTL
jgi:hypothetical protein